MCLRQWNCLKSHLRSTATINEITCVDAPWVCMAFKQTVGLAKPFLRQKEVTVKLLPKPYVANIHRRLQMYNVTITIEKLLKHKIKAYVVMN